MTRLSRGGRPSKAGKRTPSGRLSRAGHGPVEPNAHVLAVRHAFRHFAGGKATEHLSDPIGRAWAAGLLDGTPVDPKLLRDAGREYGERYWGQYSRTALVIGGAEPRSRTSRQKGEWFDADPAGVRFAALDAALVAGGRHARDAIHALVVDQHWFPDENPAWLDRLLTERLLAEWTRRKDMGQEAGQPVAGHLPTDADRARLAQCVAGLVALVPSTAETRQRRGREPSLAELTQPEAPTPAPPPPPIDPEFRDEAGHVLPWANIADVIRSRLAG